MDQQGIPKYIQVMNWILDLIERENITPGEQVPSENQLVRELKVSRNTVRQALTYLVNQGVLSKRQGAGTFFEGRKDLHAQKVSMVGVVNHSHLGSIYPQLIEGIEDALHDADLSMVLANCNFNKERELEALERMIQQGIKGLIIEPLNNQELGSGDRIVQMMNKADFPIVFTNCTIPWVRGSSVNIDDVDAGYMATRYLLDKGHRAISFVYKHQVQAGVHRMEGYQRALNEAGIDLEDDYLRAFSQDDEARHPGEFITRRLMELGRPPTAIFYYNDETALVGLHTLANLGLNVPGDISVLGYDDLPQTRWANPPLTTFSHPKYQMGKWAVELLLEQMVAHDTTFNREILVKPVLVERLSVSEPASR